MTANTFRQGIFHFFRAFFPLQLLIGHLKYNLLALIFWILLFSIVSDSLGSAYGLSYLFYSPECQGETNEISFLLIGFAIGGFTMAFHTYSYMKLGKRYPFIATISNPFIKFCLNNSLIPVVFIIYYCYKFVYFQSVEEYASAWTCFLYVLSFLFGFVLFLLLSFFYFFPRSKNVFQKIGLQPTDKEETEPVNSFFHRKVNWQNYFRYRKDRTYVYLAGLYKLRTSRSSRHYDKESLEKVFRQSKISSSFFEFITVFCFFIIGVFREHPLLDLPAGMSMVMLITIVMMIISVMTSWLYYWTYPGLIIIMVIMNVLSKHTPLFQYKNYAYGLKYDEKSCVPYNLNVLESLSSNQVGINQSRRNYVQILDNWKAKLNEEKPKLVIVMTSGGGSRSALWTFQVLQHLDESIYGGFTKHIQLITGASGGMIGASYYRSLYLEKLKGNEISLSHRKYNAFIAEDLLNKLAFSASSNDMFFRVKSFNYNKQVYTKDRGYSFEEDLDENTEGIMNHPLNYFKPYEENAHIPFMIFSPTVVNDGRRLLISTQRLTFLCSGNNASGNLTNMYENVDFRSLFRRNSDVRFLSVLRMSATFPLVLPMVSLPTKPEMHVMDAGIRDNYGGKLTMEYLYALEDWIRENTSGVIIVKIRDTKKILKGETLHKVSLFNRFTLPFGNMYDNFPRTQDFDQDELFKLGVEGFDFPVDLVIFNLRESKKDRISLSWHLTSNEKHKIEKALKSESNRLATRQLIQLLQ
ncbi:MAG: patatin-like phospholipase family protein [Bacteroidota bacterium]